jgi:hypothetical protein
MNGNEKSKWFFDTFMPFACKKAAEAVWHYAEFSGEHTMVPEYYVSSYIFREFSREFGSHFAMTLETNIGYLFDCNEEAKGRKQQNKPPAARQRFLEGLGNARVDMVVYGGDSPEKSKQRFLGMMELKRWKIAASDRDKLLNIMDVVDTCPYGAICGIVIPGPDEEWREKERQYAAAANDRWYDQQVNQLPYGIEDKFAIWARAFPRRSKAIAAQA